MTQRSAKPPALLPALAGHGAALAVLLVCVPAAARTLHVGDGQTYALPSDAAKDAGAGDTVLIEPGSYFDCAIWHAGGLTIEGTGAGATLTDKACAGKAAFVIEGDDVTIRNLTFARMRVPDGNGAGIRAEGRNLTVDNSRFENNQAGILAAVTGGTLRIAGSLFTANGAGPDGRPTHAVLAGPVDRLIIERSAFQKARGGDYIASSAGRTELRGNSFVDEGGHMQGPLITISGGVLDLQNNTVSLAPCAAMRPGAVLATGDMTALTVRGNTLTAPGGGVPLVRNWTGTAAIATDNSVPPGAAAVSDSGALYHRMRAKAAALRGMAGDAAHVLRHWVAVMARAAGLLH